MSWIDNCERRGRKYLEGGDHDLFKGSLPHGTRFERRVNLIQHRWGNLTKTEKLYLPS